MIFIVKETPNVQRPTSNVEIRNLNSTFGVRRSALGVFFAQKIGKYKIDI